MFVTDKNLRKIGVCDVALDSLERAKNVAAKRDDGSQYTIDYEIFDDVPQDSSVAVVGEIVRLCQEKGCDGVAALGGGSVIDTAKSVAISLEYGVDDFLSLQGSEMLHNNMMPLIAIPTTAGTGSEVTCVAVVANHEAKKKLSFTSYKLVPHCSIIDPKLTQSLPPGLTATTGMDALCHAVEAYVSSQKNPLSDAFAHAAVRLIAGNIKRACEKPQDIEARSSLALGATIAGVSFSNAMVGIVHSIGHTMGGMCGIPHGQAMMMLLPECCQSNYDKGVRGYGDLLLDVDEKLYLQIPSEKRDEAFIEMLRSYNNYFAEKYEVRLRLSQFKVPREQLPAIAHNSRYDGSALYNAIEVTEADCLAILEKIW